MIGGFHPWYYEELLRRINTERADQAQALGAGMADDYANYRHGVGVIEGLRLATEIATEIKKEQERAR